MSGHTTIDRREFARGSAMALVGGLTVTVSACGGGGYGGSPTAATPPAPEPPAPPAADPSPGEADGRRGVISNNHGHEAVITSAGFASPDTLMLDIRGQADHTHVVPLTVSELERIRQGTEVAKTSTDTFGHQHEATFATATPLPDEY